MAIYRGKNWHKISLEVIKRDKYLCQHCGIKGTRKTLDCHHVIPFRVFKHIRDGNCKHNLITLCKSCHAKADNKYWNEHPDQFDKRRFPYPTCPPRNCEKCGKPIKNLSPRIKRCIECCTFACKYCGKEFFVRKFSDRTPKYCSKECRNKDIETNNQTCVDCGGKCHFGAVRCRDCDTIWYRNDPAALRRGRKLKLDLALATH